MIYLHSFTLPTSFFNFAMFIHPLFIQFEVNVFFWSAINHIPTIDDSAYGYLSNLYKPVGVGKRPNIPYQRLS